MGQITNDAASVFSQKLVEELMNRPEWKLRNNSKFVFLGVDPNGGGSSDLAIISMAFEDNNLIFTGAETYPAKNHDQIDMLLCGHIRALRGHPKFRNSWIICFFESNLGLEAAHMAHMVKNERRVWVMYEKGRAGVITTNDRKAKYTDSALSYFNMGAVHFVENMVCSNPYEDANERLHKVKMEFKKQLLQFQKNVLLPANSWEIAK